MKDSIKDLAVFKSTPEKKEKQLYELITELPQPERKMALTKDQKYWWFFLGIEIVKTKQIAKSDLIHLQRAAFWLDARCKAYQRVKNYDDLVQTFKSGATNVTGHVSIIEKADKALDEISEHFGLSIRDRKKLKAEKQDPKQFNLFQQFLNQKEA